MEFIRGVSIAGILFMAATAIGVCLIVWAAWELMGFKQLLKK